MVGRKKGGTYEGKKAYFCLVENLCVNCQEAVLRIQDVNPGSRIRFFPSWIRGWTDPDVFLTQKTHTKF